MKKLIHRRQRVLRVRHVQHAQALADAVRARDEAKSLEDNAERLRSVRQELLSTEGMTTGGSFAAHGELVMRLDNAGRQLDGAIFDAKRKVDQKEGLRLVANREREIAGRLKERAVKALEDYRELQVQALPRAGTAVSRSEKEA